MKRTKKLFYVPGLISLFGILIALPSFYKKTKPIKEHCLTLFMPADCKEDCPMEYQFSSCQLEKDIIKRKKIRFTLNENSEENKRKIEVIRYEALKLKYTQDTASVILITLSDSISYGEFISLRDICEYDKHKRYASWNNKFVIFGEWPEKKKEFRSIPTFASDVIRIEKPIIKPSLLEILRKKIKQYYTPLGFYLLLGWIVLLISFLYFRKRNSVLKKY
jgi:hypothetical protein